MAGRRGRPAGGQHLRMARLLAALSSSDRGCPRSRLQKSMGLAGSEEDQKRIFMRDVRHLRALGWDIRSYKAEPGVERYRLIRIDPRFRTVFTAEERQELLRAARRAGLGELYDDLDPDLDDEPSTPDALAPPLLETAQYAVAYRCQLQLRYHGSTVTVHPYQVVHTDGRWLLHARGADESRLSHFYLDEVRHMRPSAPQTAEPTPVLPSAARHPMRWEHDAPRDAVLTAAEVDVPDVIHAFGGDALVQVDHPGSGDQRRITVQVTNLDTFFARLFYLGLRVRLIGPPALRDEARRRLRWALAKQS